MKKGLVCCILCSFVFSCVSFIDVVPRYVSPLQSVFVEDIEKSLENRHFLDALQLIDRLLREKEGISRDRLVELRTKTLQGLDGSFQDAVKNEDWSQALDLYASLVNIGEESLIPDWTFPKLLVAAGAKRERAGDDVLAVLTYAQAVGSGNLDQEQYRHILELASKTNNTVVLLDVIEAMDKRGFEVPAPFRAKSEEITPVAKMISGTVTMWVDRGVKIEKGVGMLDRVIGSGFFIDPRGYLLTNYHVIESEVNPQYEGYSRLFVRLSDKPEQKIPARVVGYDPVFDLALVKVEIEPKFIFSSLRETAVEPGEKIKVIGSPAGLENTITSGIISATGRRFLQMGDALQIDAPVNPGNSGGPVIDESGRLVGIVFAGVEQFEGINFAISIEWINKILPRLFQGNQVKHFWIGIAVTETEQGLKVIYTVPGEPADNAGVKAGDIIKQMNKTDYKKLKDFQSAVVDYEGAALVRLTLLRGGKEFSALVSLGERPRIPVKLALERDARSNVIFPLFGLRIEKVTDSFVSFHYIVQEVLAGTIAEELGLSPNDPIDIRGWVVDEEHKYAAMEVEVKRKKLGFLETYVQIVAYLEVDNFV